MTLAFDHESYFRIFLQDSDLKTTSQILIPFYKLIASSSGTQFNFCVFIAAVCIFLLMFCSVCSFLVNWMIVLSNKNDDDDVT